MNIRLKCAATLALIFISLTALPTHAFADSVVLELPPPAADGSDYKARELVAGGVSADSALSRYFSKGAFNAVAVGRYLDSEPAQRLASGFQARGLTAFVLKKSITEKKLLGKDPVGDFYFVMLGLFGDPKDAVTLGQRLKAEGALPDFAIVPVDDPGELEATDAQNMKLNTKASERWEGDRERALKPLSAKSPAASGEAFKKNVYGRYVGSYKDPLEARDHARRLTSGGWPASVEKDAKGGSLWYRVYLAPTGDTRDMEAEPKTLASAKRSASSQPGIVIVADASSLKGKASDPLPNAKRTDASACAGFSEAGRLAASITRTINYIPDTSYTATLTAITRQPAESWGDISERISNWWNDTSPKPPKKTLYGPAIFNRPVMEKAISRIPAQPEQASLALGLTESSSFLSNIPGRKVLLVFSEFQGPDKLSEAKEAVFRLKSAFGSSLTMLFIYGDCGGTGYETAAALAAEAGAGKAWDGCRLLNDNAYFEQYIKTIFR